jgi:hypothetical protein
LFCAVAAAVCFALAAVTAWAWAASWNHAVQSERRFIQDPLDRDRLEAEAYRKSGVYSYKGRVVYAVTTCNGFDLSMCGSERVLLDLDAIARGRPFGIKRDQGHTFRAWYWHRAVWIPHWFLVLTFALYPAIWLLSRARRNRGGRDGINCARCDYDLRATPDRCSECGAVPNSHAPWT